VSHSGAFDAHVIAVAHLILVIAVELLAQEGCYIVGLDGMDCGPNQIPIDGLQIGLPFKDNIGGVFGFIQTPMLEFLDLLEDGAVSRGELIQLAM